MNRDRSAPAPRMMSSEWNPGTVSATSGGPPPALAGGAACRPSPRRTRVGAEDAKEGGAAAQFGQRLGHRRVRRVRLHVHIENVLPRGRGPGRVPLLRRARLQFGEVQVSAGEGAQGGGGGGARGGRSAGGRGGGGGLRRG